MSDPSGNSGKITFPTSEALQVLAQRFKDIDVSALESFIAMVRVSLRFMSEIDTYFQARELSHGRFMMMMFLLRNEGKKVTPGDLATDLGVTRATVTGVLDTLVTQTWVERVPDPDDRRSILVTLTDAGRRKLEEMLPAHYAMIASMMAGFSADERKMLKSLMVRFAASIEQMSSKTPQP